MNWNQPICDPCWGAEQPDRTPARIAELYREDLTCCMCGRPTSSGILVRRDPREVPYPAPDVPEDEGAAG